jgi:hypothetical protein
VGNILDAMVSAEDEERLGADDVAGAVAARRALGEDAEDAVIRAFLERTGDAIDARVTERLNQQIAPVQMPQAPQMPAPQPQGPRTDHRPFVLAIISLGAGIPLTGIATQFHGAALVAVLIIWTGIVALNVVYGRRRQ